MSGVVASVRWRWAFASLVVAPVVGAVLLFRHFREPHYRLIVGNGREILLYTGHLTKTQKLIVASARDQMTWGTGYDAAYCVIGYPGGDVPHKKGVCTDVVIRSLRSAGFDLQVAIHHDIAKHWSLYPRYEYNPKPDTNIDHRRVPNQRVFFKRFGKTLTTSTAKPKDWMPGDVIEWVMPHGHDHTGILSDHTDREGFPLVIHNLGEGPQENDAIRIWKVVGHFRYPKS